MGQFCKRSRHTPCKMSPSGKRRIFSLRCLARFLTFNQIIGSAVDSSGQNTYCPLEVFRLPFLKILQLTNVTFKIERRFENKPIFLLKEKKKRRKQTESINILVEIYLGRAFLQNRKESPSRLEKMNLSKRRMVWSHRGGRPIPHFL